VCFPGLQKEGWFIFRHLMTELLVLAVGFFTFVPAIQVQLYTFFSHFIFTLYTFEECILMLLVSKF